MTSAESRMVKKVVRRLHYSEEYCYGSRVGLDWKPLTSRDQYSSCGAQTQYPKLSYSLRSWLGRLLPVHRRLGLIPFSDAATLPTASLSRVFSLTREVRQAIARLRQPAPLRSIKWVGMRSDRAKASRRNRADLAGACFGGQFVVSRAGVKGKARVCKTLIGGSIPPRASMRRTALV
jgi:hypothetical protein